MTQHRRSKIDEADKLFSRLVVSSMSCRKCYRNDYLTCAHIISRRYLSVRWNPENAMCLCFTCHRYFEEHPLEWREFVDSKFGGGHYDKMSLMANDVFRGDIQLLIDAMRAAL